MIKFPGVKSAKRKKKRTTPERDQNPEKLRGFSKQKRGGKRRLKSHAEWVFIKTASGVKKFKLPLRYTDTSSNEGKKGRLNRGNGESRDERRAKETSVIIIVVTAIKKKKEGRIGTGS